MHHGTWCMSEAEQTKIKELTLQHDALQLRIRQMHTRSHKGIWLIGAFTILSVPALLSHQLFPPLSDSLKQTLGASPSPTIISVLLVIYAFSAILLILTKIANGTQQKFGAYSHLGYLSGFYMFYYFSESLTENFWAVFAAGITILCLESYFIWSNSMALARELQDELALLDRKRNLLL